MEALGRYFAEFACLEFIILAMFSRILGHGDNHEISGAIFKRVRSLSDRIRIVQDAAAAAKLGDPVIEAVNILCEELAKINTRRNIYAHATYGPDDDGGVRIKTYVFSAGKKPGMEALTVEKIEEDIDAIKRAVVMAFLWTGHLKIEETPKPSL